MSTNVSSPFHQLLVERTPRVIVTPALIAANVLAYAAIAGASGHAAPDTGLLIDRGALFGPSIANGEWWRLVSSMFLHVGILHLAFNCLLLWQVGRIVERLLGPFAFLAIYIVTGVTGSMAGLAWHPNLPSAGASGALFGIVGVLLAIVLSGGGQMHELLHDRPISVGLSQLDAEAGPREASGIGEAILPVMRDLRVGLFWFLIYNVIFAFSSGGIDLAAHAGGFAGGLAFGWLVARDAITRRPPLRRVVLPVIAATALAAVQIERLRAHGDVLSESMAFSAVDNRNLAQFDATWNAVAAGRMKGEEAAGQVERSVLPDMQAALDRCQPILREASDNLTRASALEQYGRARDWQHLAQFRDDVTRAQAWFGFLRARQENWRLRVRSLREDNATLVNQANLFDREAMGALVAVLQSAPP